MNGCTRCHVVQETKTKQKRIKKAEQEHHCIRCQLVKKDPLFTQDAYPSEKERICLECMNAEDEYQYLVSKKFWEIRKLSPLQKSKIIKETMRSYKEKRIFEVESLKNKAYQQRLKFLLEMYG